MYQRILAWALHLLAWLVVVFFTINSSLVWGAVIVKTHDTLIPQLYGAATNALLFYGTCFYLIPRFYTKNSRLLFYGISIVVLTGVSVGEAIIDYFWWTRYIVERSTGPEQYAFLSFLSDNFIYIAPINVLYYTLGFGYRFPITKRLHERREQHLEKERLNAELRYLKAQIDPHTLFNGMNSIYHLIDTDPAKAKETVLRFSELIRYQLYDCQEELISLEQEVKYLSNYIELNKVRKGDDCTIDVMMDYDDETVRVAPLIFTPFLENAFKYLSNHSDPEANRLKVELGGTTDRIEFMVENTIDAETKPPEQGYGGIGILNSRNRLDLIYGNDYQLKYGRFDDVFRVGLEIRLR